MSRRKDSLELGEGVDEVVQVATKRTSKRVAHPDVVVGDADRIRSGRTRMGKVSLMSLHDLVIGSLVGSIALREAITKQHVNAIGLDHVFRERGLPEIAASMDWDDEVVCIPLQHTALCASWWGEPTDRFRVLVGPDKEPFWFEDREEFPVYRIVDAFTCAAAVADRDGRLEKARSMPNRDGSVPRILEIDYPSSERDDVKVIRVRDKKMVCARIGGNFGYMTEGGKWGVWERASSRKGGKGGGISKFKVDKKVVLDLFPSKTVAAVASFLDLDIYDMDGYLKPTKLKSCPVYFVENRYYAAKKGKTPPKTGWDGDEGWRCGGWELVGAAAKDEDDKEEISVWMAVQE